MGETAPPGHLQLSQIRDFINSGTRFYFQWRAGQRLPWARVPSWRAPWTPVQSRQQKCVCVFTLLCPRKGGVQAKQTDFPGCLRPKFLDARHLPQAWLGIPRATEPLWAGRPAGDCTWPAWAPWSCSTAPGSGSPVHRTLGRASRPVWFSESRLRVGFPAAWWFLLKQKSVPSVQGGGRRRVCDFPALQGTPLRGRWQRWRLHESGGRRALSGHGLSPTACARHGGQSPTQEGCGVAEAPRDLSGSPSSVPCGPAAAGPAAKQSRR